MKQRTIRALGRLGPATLAACAGLYGASGCGSSSDGLAQKTENLEVECLGETASAPSDAWLCPAPKSVDCSALASLPPLYVRDGANPSCGGAALDGHVSGELRPGATYPVRVTRGDGSVACETSVTVTDNAPPVLTPKTLNLWPPNHKFHTISVEDCVAVSDSCERDLKAEFVWASSDEPIDDLGDGHHAPDILIDDCRRVQVRAERQGPKDGRVYKLGVRVVDGAGNAAESACTIIIDHDKRGVLGADSGESYRVTFDGQNGRPACDGENPPPPPPEFPPPPPTIADAGTPPPPPPPPGDAPDGGFDEPIGY